MSPNEPIDTSFGRAPRSVTCMFCEIVARRAPASFVYEDALVSAFMTIRPTADGECLIVPKTHIDHFIDLPDSLAQHIIGVAQRIGRRMRQVFPLERVGYLVHGFGVAHAHFIIVPQQGVHHLTSERFVRAANDNVIFDLNLVPVADRPKLDEQARLLASGLLPNEH